MAAAVRALLAVLRHETRCLHGAGRKGVRVAVVGGAGVHVVLLVVLMCRVRMGVGMVLLLTGARVVHDMWRPRQREMRG